MKIKVGVLIFLSIILFSNFASAYYYFPSFRGISESILNTWVDFLEPFLQALLGGDGWSGFFLFEKLLIAIVLVSIIAIVLDQVPLFQERSAIRWIVSIVVTIIGVRYLDYGWITAIITQYQVLAIALIGILPIIIYFFFLHTALEGHSAMRRIGWIFFGVVYFGLWATTNSENASIYFWTMIVALIAFAADGTIARYFFKKKISEGDATVKAKFIADLKKDIDETRKSVRNGYMDQKTGDRLIRRFEKQLKNALKHM